MINHYSGSVELGMEYRHFYLAKELQALGHEVSIVASEFSHLRIAQPVQSTKKWTEHLGISHLWLSGRSYSGNGIRRLFNMLDFSRSLWHNALNIAVQRKPEIILASSPHPFCSYGAARLARIAGAKFIFEIRDLWPLSLMELGSMSPNHPLIRLLDHAEAYGCRHAHRVVSLLPCVDDYMERRGVHRDKWTWVSNGILPSEWQTPCVKVSDRLAETLSTLKAQGFSIVGYAGTHGLANSLDTLIDSAKLMQGENVAFVLVGGGSEKAALQRRAQVEGLKNVWLIDAVNKPQIPALLQRFDVAYIGLRRQSVYRFGIAPNKLMDYMMAGKPILHAVEAGNDPVGESGCGLTVQPEDPRALAQGIRSLLGLSEDERKVLGRRGQAFVLKNHTYPVLAKRFLATCSQ